MVLGVAGEHATYSKYGQPFKESAFVLDELKVIKGKRRLILDVYPSCARRGGGGQLGYWFEESLLCFLRQSDLLRVQGKGLLSEASRANPFSANIFLEYSAEEGMAGVGVAPLPLLVYGRRAWPGNRCCHCGGFGRNSRCQLGSTWRPRPAISHCWHLCIQIADKLRRERRPQFGYKRPLFQCNDFVVKKRKMLKNKGR
jgi:hypothetical protein